MQLYHILFLGIQGTQEGKVASQAAPLQSDHHQIIQEFFVEMGSRLRVLPQQARMQIILP